MNRDNIIRLAREAGLYTKCEVYSAVPFDQLLERFFHAAYAAGAAAEREACAKVAETIQEFGLNVATAIRARGQE